MNRAVVTSLSAAFVVHLGFVGMYAAAATSTTVGRSEKKLVRTELLAESEGGLRFTHLLDPTKLEGHQRLASYYLFSVGGDISFVERIEIDQGNQSRRFLIATERKNERVEFVRDGRDPRLSVDEQRQKVGFLRTRDEELKIAADDAGLKTVRLRTRAILDGWRADRVEALRKVYRAIVGCQLPIGKGDLLPILFPDVAGEQTAVACPYQFKRVDPDPARDIRFVSIEPELASWLKKRFALTQKPAILTQEEPKP